MNTTQVKNNSQDKAKNKKNASGGKLQKSMSLKQKKQNPETIAAKRNLILMSHEAQEILKEIEEGVEDDYLLNYAHCTCVNDVLLVMHKENTGFKDFRRFDQWKEAGFAVKKGEKSYRVWGTPKRIPKNGAEETKEKQNAEDTYKYWPMCSLFNESQVEKIDGDKPEHDEPEKNNELNGLTPETKNQAINENETLTRGMFPQSDGTILVMTFTESKILKTKSGAKNWLKKRGLDEFGNEIKIDDQNEPENNLVVNSPYVTTDFEERKEAKIDRLQEKANKANAKSKDLYKDAKLMAHHIPFGQPITLGHHSENRDRNYRNKITKKFRQSFEEMQKAEDYQNKADSVGSGGILSNDPDALVKLKNKLSSLEEKQRKMKSINAIIRASNLTEQEKIAEMMECENLTIEEVELILKPDFCGNIGFAAYKLTNNNAEINRIKKRISSLTKIQTLEPIDYKNEQFHVYVDNGYININFFEGKPSKEVRKLINKSYHFKLSGFQNNWVRKATLNAIYEAEELLNNLKKIEEIY